MVEKEEGGPGGISEEEAAQYDRQIRLWGLEAQKRLRASRVLLVGMKGLGAEVAKNLILAGVKGLTMLDHQQQVSIRGLEPCALQLALLSQEMGGPGMTEIHRCRTAYETLLCVWKRHRQGCVSQEDTRAQFLIPVGSLGRNRAEASLERAQNLNPMVDVKADPESVENKPEEFFTQFDAVCLTCCSRDVMVKIDQICHKNSIKFFTGDVFGYHGYMFANLGEHEFVEEKTKVTKVSPGVEDGPDTKKAKLDSSETTMVKKRVVFCQLKEALAVDWSSEKAKAALKRTTPDYFLLQVLLKFRTDKGRDPLPQSYAEDSKLLLQIRSDVLDSLGVSMDLLPDDFISYCFSEMAPVCAVVGGVLGQEVVKALSQRDPPHNNFFFFDGIKGNGIVECLGPK
ncbi:SUMO-activating enzyme subunit 1 isoform X1 [Apteryx rowi]|uniref:SUMO-activating enzyme subunit 1 isoform X1 n=2 Tax=Apteryx rowi TaxID=308060 RepID=UPI000E1CF2B6|nr:SUMO-activating enzyme subunit 1 isoform X1 [Apteryx rowi]